MLQNRAFLTRLISVPVAAFRRSRRGTVAIVGAVALTTFLAALGMAFNLGQALIAQTENQRVADLAAYAGALAYSAKSSTTTMQSAAQSIAALHGVPSANITTTLVTSPRNANNKAVNSIVQSTQVNAFASMLNAANLLTIGAGSYVEIDHNTINPPCVMALSQSGTGITMTGGTSISAPNCTVVSNNTLTVPCGTTITAKQTTYDSSSAPAIGCGGVTPTPTKAYTSDPYAGLSNVTSGTAMLPAAETVKAPAPPSLSGGTSITFSTTAGGTAAAAATAGCSATLSGTTWTMNCTTPSTTYKFGTITVDSSEPTVIINTVASSTYDFSGTIVMLSNKSLTFGPGTYNIAAGIYNAGTMSMGAGTYTIGNNTNGCDFSICTTGTLTIAGPSTFSLSNGVTVGGSASATLGSGSTNSFQIGAGTDGTGDALSITGGSAHLTLADASLFQLAGNIDAPYGSSCVTLSATPVHQVNGFLMASGGVTLGAGVWVVPKYVGFGANTGGDVICNGTETGVSANGVTFVIGGTAAFSSQSCQGFNVVFCIGEGYGHVTLVAPTSGATAWMAVIGPTASSNTYGAAFAQGSTDTSISGAFYFPNGELNLSGGANVSSPSGGCMTFVGSQITTTGGASAATSCPSLGSTSTSLSLVQ